MTAVETRRAGREEPGECLLRMVDGQLTVLKADPKVWMADDFLGTLVGSGFRNQWVTLTYSPAAGVTCDPSRCCQRFRDGHCYYGAVVTVAAINRTVVYKIGAFLRGGVWEAQIADK